MKRGVLALIGLISGCGGRSGFAELELSVSTEDASPAGPDCSHDTRIPAQTLDCTGLYSSLADKELAEGVHPFAPAVPLWSDGAAKYRFMALPEGETIDASNPMEWKFPIGTKFWKEFRVGNKRVETRLFQKILENHWEHAAYAWNEDETEAVATGGGDITLSSGVPYHIPTRDECEDCHRGRSDRILGFDQVLLGLPGATGVTLADLVSEGRISPPPPTAPLEIGDDGTGVAAEALGWLHTNCGTTCHNDNPGAKAYGEGMRLRLDPTLLDGRPSAEFEALTTTVNVSVNTPTWFGRFRIVPGRPEESLLVELITNRRSENPGMSQMPPIATRVVDVDNTANVIEWIRRMPSDRNGTP